MKTVVNPHDKFFKEMLSQIDRAKDFISHALPIEIAEKLDLKNLQLDTNSYIDSQLETGFSDVVYNCHYKGIINTKIALLFEHKSYVVPFPHLQLLGYMLKIWETNIKNKQALTPIIPIIFYHGTDSWQQKKFNQYFNELDDNLKRFVPDFDYLLIDTINWSDEQIKQMFSSMTLQIGMLLIKNIFDEVKLLRDLHKIFENLQKILETTEGEKTFESFITYIFSATKINMTEVADKIKDVSPKGSEIILTGYEKAQLKGELRGINKRAIKTAVVLIDLGLDNEQIVKATDLGISQINNLREMISKGIAIDEIENE